MTDVPRSTPSDSKISEINKAGNDKPIAGTPITDKIDNVLQQRLSQREALRAFRLTRDPTNSFSIEMSDGTKVTDKRPISPLVNNTKNAQTMGKVENKEQFEPAITHSATNNQGENTIDSVRQFINRMPASHKHQSLVENISERNNLTSAEIVAGNPNHELKVRSDATNTKDLKTEPERHPAQKAEQLEAKAEQLILQRLSITADLVKKAHDRNSAAHTKKDDLYVHSFDFQNLKKSYTEFSRTAQEVVDSFKKGDLNQKIVSDLGIEPIPVADLKNSTGTTSKLDQTLAKAQLDPMHYNCNDYVQMFVFAKENPSELEQQIQAHTGPSYTDTPEGFLKQHGYSTLSEGPLQDGDIIIIHRPRSAHSAVICTDPETHELYTMQKPNPSEMPVRMSMDQLSRAEKIANANIEVYRK